MECAYRKAPYYSEVMPILEQFLLADYYNLAEYNVASNKLVCNYLGINTEILLSSELNTDKTLKRQYSIFDECRVLGGNEYINAIGGMELYDFEELGKMVLNLPS